MTRQSSSLSLPHSPKIEGADIAAVFVGKRVAGDFYDSVRVSPERVLIGMLDVAGRRENNRTILNAPTRKSSAISEQSSSLVRISTNPTP